MVLVQPVRRESRRKQAIYADVWQKRVRRAIGYRNNGVRKAGRW